MISRASENTKHKPWEHVLRCGEIFSLQDLSARPPRRTAYPAGSSPEAPRKLSGRHPASPRESSPENTLTCFGLLPGSGCCLLVKPKQERTHSEFEKVCFGWVPLQGRYKDVCREIKRKPAMFLGAPICHTPASTECGGTLHGRWELQDPHTCK